MTQYSWPSAALFVPTEQRLLVVNNDEISESPLSGHVQVISRPGARWGWDVTIGNVHPDELAQLEAFAARMTGRLNTVLMYDFLRPSALGTINQSGVKTNGQVDQFSYTVNLKNCGDTKTLLAGSWMKIGSQLFMVVADGLSNGSGNMAVEVRHEARTDIASDTDVVFTNPTSAYALAESNFESPRQAGYGQPGASFRFVERF